MHSRRMSTFTVILTEPVQPGGSIDRDLRAVAGWATGDLGALSGTEVQGTFDQYGYIRESEDDLRSDIRSALHNRREFVVELVN